MSMFSLLPVMKLDGEWLDTAAARERGFEFGVYPQTAN